MFNKKLYKKLLSFRSHSGSQCQEDFRDWLEDYIQTKYPEALVQTDSYGSLYVTKETTSQGTVNCVIAHLDINQSVQTSNFSVVEAGDFIVGINNDTGHQIGLGHDDKTGVYFALMALEKFDNIKCYFPLDEEIGCKGSRESEDEFFENVGFMVQLDRRGYNEISQYTNGHYTVLSETKLEFNKILAKYNFVWANTVSTDVGVLVQKYGIQGTNIACAYMNEHKDNETLNVLRYETCEKFAMSILAKTNGTYYYMPIEKRSYSNTSTTSTSTVNTNASTKSTSSTSNTTTAVTKRLSVSTSNDSKTTSQTVLESEKKNTIHKSGVDVDEADAEIVETEEECLTQEIESLYDLELITQEDMADYTLTVKELYGKWENLAESYDKDVILTKFHTALTDLDHVMKTEMLTYEFSDITAEWEALCRLYEYTPKEMTENAFDTF